MHLWIFVDSVEHISEVKPEHIEILLQAARIAITPLSILGQGFRILPVDDLFRDNSKDPTHVI